MKTVLPTEPGKRPAELPQYLDECISMDNPYAEKYISLSCSGQKHGRIVHHVVPVYFFKKVLGMKTVRRRKTSNHDCSADMDPLNLARLSPVQHLVAHYYLHKCSVPLLQRQADRSFMTMFMLSGKKLLVDSENEYSCLYEDMLNEFNSMMDVYGKNFVAHIHSTKDEYDEASSVNTEEFPKISYYIVKKNPERGRSGYSARVYQNGKEATVYLYREESLSRIWLERVKRMYDIALDHYLETGNVPDYIKKNMVTAYNLRDTYQKYLPVPFGSTLPKMTYYITKRYDYGYFLTINEDGKRTKRSLHTKSIIVAKRIVARIQRVYDEAVSLDSRGIPVPDELRQMILRLKSGKVEDYMKPGNVGLVNFITGGCIEVPNYRLFSKKSKRILFVIDEWEKTMRDSGLTESTIDTFTRVPRKYMDTSLTIDMLSSSAIQDSMDKIKATTTAWYRTIRILHLFIKFAAGRYELPANLVAMCEISKPTKNAA